MNNKELLLSIFTDVFSVNPEDINANFTRETVENWDSVRHLSLINGIEEKFDIFLEMEEILGISSFESAMSILSSSNNISFE